MNKDEAIKFISKHRQSLDNTLVIGIVGSRRYQSGSKIRKFIFQLNKKSISENKNLVICSGGQKQGADGFARKYALEFDIKYIEFPPAHYPYNQFCILPIHYYNKPYRPYYYLDRNTHIAELSDKIIAFIPDKIKLEESRGTNDTCTKAKKLGKKVIVMY
jgi:hypothetical protein